LLFARTGLPCPLCGRAASDAEALFTACADVVRADFPADLVVADPLLVALLLDPLFADPPLADPVFADPVLADPLLADPLLPALLLADPVLAARLADDCAEPRLDVFFMLPPKLLPGCTDNRSAAV
jgi:hypothetical protein